MDDLIIISIVYHEPEWQQTKACIEATGLPVHYVERNPKGIGSLSEAINRGFRECNAMYYKFAWIVTNVTFEPDLPGRLAKNMGNHAAIHPAFDSDHIHERPDGSGEVKAVPFIEFTAAMVDTEVHQYYPLDEKMPYWGMDLDYSYRLWQDGYNVAVDHSAEIGHTYIRNKQPNHYTIRRKAARKANDHRTKQRLSEKYGREWRDIVFPKTEKQIGEFYERVKLKIAV